MEKNPLVSIGIPAYNSGKFIEEMLRSIMRQTYTNLEIIISDDASTDETGDIVQKLMKEDSRIRYIRQAKNRGNVENFNWVAAEATSEFLALYHSDDIYEPTIVEKELELLMNGKAQAVLTFFNKICMEISGYWHLDFSIFNGLPQAGNVFFIHDFHDMFRRYLRFGNYFCCPSLMILKSEFFRAGCYRDRYSPGPEDLDLWFTLVRQGTVLAVVGEELLHCRVSDSHTTHRILQNEVCGWDIPVTAIISDLIEQDPSLVTREEALELRRSWTRMFYDYALKYYSSGKYDAACRAIEEAKKYDSPDGKGEYVKNCEEFRNLQELILAEKREVFLHPNSDVSSCHIGVGTRIWQFCVVLTDAKIGNDCNIGHGTIIENDVVVGSRVTVKDGCFLCDGVTLEDDVFIGPGVKFTNDKKPRSRYRDVPKLQTFVQEGAAIGANSVILPGLMIGPHAMIGAGSIVTKNIPAGETWAGNPARKMETKLTDCVRC